VLWDCVSLLDGGLAEMIRGLGGLRAIAISHPHYYTTMVDWAQAFGCPVLLHEDDREWVMRPDPSIEHWSGETREIAPGLTLVRCGGHFPGATVLHWAAGAEGRGALLSGDVLQVTPGNTHVSFMYSFPNYIPVSAETARRVAAAVEPFAFDQVWGAWWGRGIRSGAKAAVRESAQRYVAAVGGG
jgi:glyoxylase-like metal-dependent hydrolase (beta-lactamase superfamily II)